MCVSIQHLSVIIRSWFPELVALTDQMVDIKMVQNTSVQRGD